MSLHSLATKWVTMSLLLLLVSCSNGQTSDPPAQSYTEPLAMASLPVDTPQPEPPRPVSLEENEKVFEKDIRRFEAMEDENPTPPGGILFTGSSSIRKWETLEEDMAPLPVTNRGFGGSTIRQVDAYTKRIIVPLQPRLIVLYCGENDISNDKFPAESALQDFEHFVELVRHHLPEVKIAYISMKPSPARWKYWEKFEEGNQMIAEYCADDSGLTYVDIGKSMIGENGEPNENIFVRDRLHMNESGYAIWTDIIRPVVEKLY